MIIFLIFKIYSKNIMIVQKKLPLWQFPAADNSLNSGHVCSFMFLYESRSAGLLKNIQRLVLNSLTDRLNPLN